MIQLEFAHLISIAGGVLTLIGVLIGYIVRLHCKQLETMNETVKAAFDRVNDVERLVKAEEKERFLAVQALADKRAAEHKDAFSRAFTRMEALEGKVHQTEMQVSKQVADLEVTVSGFGGIYATKHELERCQDSPSRHAHAGGPKP